MKRYLSVWLPRWPIERRFARVAAPERNGRSPLSAPPFVLFVSSQGGQHVTATTPAAENCGIYSGMALADARAIEPSLIVEPADFEGDEAALTRLALWHQRYSPYARADQPDGLSLDITGCAHLFGGEAAMLEEISRRLQGFGLTARLASAPTIGAAWAAARYAPEPLTIMTPETLHDHLAPLPAAALRLEESVIAALAKLGLKQIRDLLGKPRAPLVARFGPVLVERLDCAFGKQAESFSPLSPPSAWRAERRFAEPLITVPAMECAVQYLARDLAETLRKAGKGARKVRLSLFRVDGWSKSLSVQTSALSLSRDEKHLARLLCERLDAVEDSTGFGFEAATLSAFDVEHYVPYQNHFGAVEIHQISPLSSRPSGRKAAQSRDPRPLAPHSDHGSRIAQFASQIKDLGGRNNCFDGFRDDMVRQSESQQALKESRAQGQNGDDLNRLLDRLANRFGAKNVVRFQPEASYIPERSAVMATALDGDGGHDWKAHARALQGGENTRPLLMFAQPEPVTTLAEVPDGPPIRFTWRRVTRRIARADGPERIAPEWWRTDDENRQTRDYYRVEDETGHRYWLYRDGLHEREDDTPRWFIHGVFP